MPFDSLFQATPKLDSPSLPRDYENTSIKTKVAFFLRKQVMRKKNQSVSELRGGSATPATMTGLLQYCANLVRHVKFTIAAGGLKILIHFPFRF